MVQNKSHQKALKLRLGGKSYGEIRRTIGIPKSTLSSWFKDLKLSASVQKVLLNKKRATNKYLMKFNRERTLTIQVENQKITKNSLKEIKRLSEYEIKLIGAALYWGEGYKNQKRNSKCVQISNSDPYLIALFLRFLREVVNVPEERLKVSIFIHTNVSAAKAIKFWSKVTNIASNRFQTAVSISSASKRKRPPKSLPYGTLKLSVNSRQNFYQIKGWIDGLIKQTNR